MERKVTKIVQGKRTKDGAGVSLVRILGQTSKSRTGNSQLDKTLISLNSQPSTLITSHLSQLSTLNSQPSQLLTSLNSQLSSLNSHLSSHLSPLNSIIFSICRSLSHAAFIQ